MVSFFRRKRIICGRNDLYLGGESMIIIDYTGIEEGHSGKGF